MTTLESSRKAGNGFFSIYKPGQGKWVRWGTVAGMAIIVAFGAYWLAQELVLASVVTKTIVAAVWILGCGLGVFWAVNSPKLAEFMIMTESEMRKVSWPTRREVISSTKIVIILTVVLGVLLYFVDVFFLKFFQIIGIA